MPNNWTTITISDLVAMGEAEIKTGPFGTQLHASDYVEEGTPVLNAGNVGFGDIRTEKLDFISVETVNRLSSHLLRPEDIIFGRKGTVERHAFIRDRHTNWFQGTDCLRLRLKSPSIEPRFVSYYFLTDYHKQWIKNQSSHGATMTSLNQAIIGRITFDLPPLHLQRKIIDILSAYDDLIENNTRRIRILEQMAQAIYQQWFGKVDKDSPPDGWEKINYSDLLESYSGGDWGEEQPDQKENCPAIIIRGTDFPEVKNGNVLRAPTRYISKTSLEKRGLRVGDIVVENSVNASSRCVGTTLLITKGILQRIDGDVICASFCKNFRLKDPSLAPLVYLHMRFLYKENLMPFYQNIAANGIGNFQAERFVNTEAICVPKDKAKLKKILDTFSNLTSSVYADQIANLRQTRDMLLPRLVSGAIEVSKMEI